jgi:hypothetical protein
MIYPAEACPTKNYQHRPYGENGASEEATDAPMSVKTPGLTVAGTWSSTPQTATLRAEDSSGIKKRKRSRRFRFNFERKVETMLSLAAILPGQVVR